MRRHPRAVDARPRHTDARCGRLRPGATRGTRPDAGNAGAAGKGLRPRGLWKKESIEPRRLITKNSVHVSGRKSFAAHAGKPLRFHGGVDHGTLGHAHGACVQADGDAVGVAGAGGLGVEDEAPALLGR